MTQNDITLSRQDVNRLMGDRKRLVAVDQDVAMAQLLLGRLYDDMDALESAKNTFEQEHGWLIGDGDPPEVVEGDDGGASLIFAAYKLTCERLDKRSGMILSGAKLRQEALVKHEDYKAKAGQMIGVNTAFAALIKLGGLAQRFIPDNRKSDFLAGFAEIQADFVRENPMLRLTGAGDESH